MKLRKRLCLAVLLLCMHAKLNAQKYLFHADSCQANNFPQVKALVHHRGYGETILKKEQLEVREDNKRIDFSLTPIDDKGHLPANKRVLLLVENHYKPKGVTERDFFANVISSGIGRSVNPGDKFMIATFDWHRNGKYIFPQLQKFTDDTAALRNALTNLHAPPSLNNEQDGADINSALLEAMNYLSPVSDSLPTAIILFSDELGNIAANVPTALDVKNRSFETKIPVYAISYKMHSRYSSNIRDQICLATFGRYFISPENDLRTCAGNLKDFLDEIIDDYQGTTFAFAYTTQQEKNGQKLNLKFDVKNSSLADVETLLIPSPTLMERVSRNWLAVSLGALGVLLLVFLLVFYLRKTKREQQQLIHKNQEEISRQSELIERERAASGAQLQAMQQQQLDKERERLKEEQNKKEEDRLVRLMLSRGVFPNLRYTYKDVTGKVDISLPVFTIGRDKTNHFFIQMDTVSRKHATILFDESGTYTIVDNNSSNGTFVNGVKVKQAILKSDDVIQIGDINLIFQN